MQTYNALTYSTVIEELNKDNKQSKILNDLENIYKMCA